MTDSLADRVTISRERRKRLERIRKRRAELETLWNWTTPLARQAAALDLACDQVPWLLAEVDWLTEENEDLSAQLDDCQEQLGHRRQCDSLPQDEMVAASVQLRAR